MQITLSPKEVKAIIERYIERMVGIPMVVDETYTFIPNITLKEVPYGEGQDEIQEEFAEEIDSTVGQDC